MPSVLEYIKNHVVDKLNIMRWHKSKDDIDKETTDGLPSEFVPYYEKHILPLVDYCENARLQALENSKIYVNYVYFILGPLFIIVAIYIYATEGVSLIKALLLFAFFFAALRWSRNAPITKYQSAVKFMAYPVIFKYFGDDYVYRQHSLLNEESLKSSGIIPKKATIECTDCVKGSFNHVDIEIGSTRIYDRIDKTGEISFGGLVIILSMNKKFSGKTIIKRDEGTLINIHNNGLRDGKYSKVDLEDPLFEKKYEVFSTDQVEARYLLTTSFMDRLLRLERIYNSKLMASFYDDKLLLMIPQSNGWLQEPTINSKVTFINESKAIIEQVHEIYKIINLFKLNERTGL